MNRTEEAETATLTTLFHVVRKGSRFLVTGLILVVLTEASYSGLVCSPSSKWLRSHSQESTACRRFQNSRKVVAQKDMRQAKATVMPLSKRYVTLERMQESLKGQKGQNSGHIGHMVSFPAPVLLHMSCDAWLT